MDATMDSMQQVRRLLADTLGLGKRADVLQPDSPLLGSVPELDSTAVIQVIAEMEERFGFSIDDDEISADIFDTLGSLAAFVDQKLAQ